MMLSQDQMSVLSQDQSVLMDGMIRHNAYPILLQQEVTDRTANPDTGDIEESTSESLVTAYISSPTIDNAIALQHEIERIFESVSPARPCRCAEKKESLEIMLYGDSGTEIGLCDALIELEEGLRQATANLANIKAIYAYDSVEQANESIETLLTTIDTLSEKSDAHQDYAGMLSEQVKNITDFVRGFSQQSRVIESLAAQIKDVKKRIKSTEQELSDWPKNIPAVVTITEPVTCGKCKRIIPTPISMLYASDTEFERCSQILFGKSWPEMREILPYSQIKTILTAAYTWGFKPLENITDPFAQNMSEIMGMITTRLPHNRRWLRYILNAMPKKSGDASS